MSRVLPAVVVALLVGAPVALAQTPAPETLGVLGQGTAEATPDVASFRAEVVRTSPSSAGARQAANGRLRSIVGRLRSLGIPRASITTTSVTLQRRRIRVRSGALRVRYTAAGSFSVKIDGIAAVGRALDVVADAGATGVDGPEFDVSPAVATQARTAAENAAMTDARRRADAAAASQGQKVVGVQSIELDPGSAPSPASPDEASDFGGGTTSTQQKSTAPVLPGAQTYESSVRVVYLLGPA